MTSTNNPHALPTDRPPDVKTSIGFPKTSCSLWDKTAAGNPVFLHMGYYRKPKICIPEKILRLIQHQCENYSQTHHMLIGSLVIEEDVEGVQFQVDRLDTRNKIPTDGSGLAPGDLLIPLEVSNNTDKERSGSVEDYHCAIKRLQSRCCSKASVDLCEFLLLRGWGSYYSNAHSSVVHLDFDMVTMETVFRATPIPPVPILLTALSKNLAGPMSFSHMQGTTKTGYLSMDHTRKLLLVLESDPKACSLPLIGIWVSGAEFVQHPFVWASCLRYIHNTHLQDRVCMPPDEFLLVVYTPLHSRPEFYQCSPTTGSSGFQFQLRTGHEVANLTKTLSAPCHDFTEIELDAFEGGTKMELFDAAKAEHGLELFGSETGEGNVSLPEDIEPRCVPTPHMERVPSIRPMVPDVSILWAEPSESLPQQQLSNQQAASLQSSHAKLSKFCQPEYIPRSHPTSVNMNLQERTSASPVQNASITPSSHMQQYSQAQSGQIIVSSTGNMGNKKSLSQVPKMFYDSAVRGASIQPHMAQVPHPYLASSYVSGTCRPAVPLSTYGVVPPEASHTHSTSSSHGYQSEISENIGLSSQGSLWPQLPKTPLTSQQSHVQRHLAPQAANQSSSLQTPVGAQSSLGNHRNDSALPQSTSDSISSKLPPHWQAQTMNTHPHSNGIPFLTTVVEESSSSQSSSSSSLPNSTTQVPHKLNGNILALSSQSLGFNSTKGTGSSHNNSNSTGTCQSSDDDDSGLSITPDRVNTYPPQQSIPGVDQSQAPPSSAATIQSASVNPCEAPASSTSAAAAEARPGSGLDGVKWDEVPPAVRALLEQQNQQLKVLQQQIQLLLHNQSQQSAFSANQSHQTSSAGNPSSQCCHSSSTKQTSTIQSKETIVPQQQPQQAHNLTASHDKTTETCSVGVNTTILEDSNSGHNTLKSHSVQTSPVRTFGQQNVFLSPVLGDGSDDCHTDEGIPPSGNTPSELQHHSRPPISSTTYETPNLALQSRSGGILKSKLNEGDHKMDENAEERQFVSPKDLDSAMAGLPIQDQTMNTMASELVLDMPDYVSSVNDGIALDHSCSPPSVSKCYGPHQDDSFSTVAEDAMDPKQYYSQLMNNIQMFLTNDKNYEADAAEDHGNPGTSLEIPSPIKSGAGSSANSSMIPRINYVSMMLGSSVSGSPVSGRGASVWDADPGQSMEINAMAMKYLSDEQLTQMAMLRQMHNSTGDGQDRKTARALQKVMEKHYPAANSHSSADISRLGISPNNMTMATQKYLEKHGLLGTGSSMVMTPGRGQDSREPSMFDHSLKLRTDFSMAQSGSGINISGSRKDGNNGVYRSDSPVKSPLRQNVINIAPSCVKQDIPNTADGYTRNLQDPDIGASPVLKPFSSSSKQKTSSASTKVMKLRERPRNAPPPHQGLSPRQALNARQNDSISTDDADEENILDIAKLKQMPKLL